MKYLLSLILLLVFFVPTFVIAEEVVEIVDERYEVYYHGEDSDWIVLDDSSYKKSNNIKYFDKEGEPVHSLSLNDNDKVLAEIEYPEDSRLPGEVISLQLYKKGSVPIENALENGDEASNLGGEQLPKKEEKPLYKENGVWKN